MPPYYAPLPNTQIVHCVNVQWMDLSVVPRRNQEAGPLSVLLAEEEVSADSAAALVVVVSVLVAVPAVVVVAVEALQ